MSEKVFGLVEKLDDLKVFDANWTLREVTVSTPLRMAATTEGQPVWEEPGDLTTIVLVLDRRFPDDE